MVLKNWTATCKRIKSDHCLIPCTKLNLKWVKELMVTCETIKLTNKNIGSELFDIGLGNICIFWKSPQARATKGKINQITSNEKALAQQSKPSKQKGS